MPSDTPNHYDIDFNSVQTRCIVKGEAQKSLLFWRFSGGFWFSQDRLFSRNSTGKPLNLIKSPIFTNAPCKTTCLYNAPSMHTVDLWEVLHMIWDRFALSKSQERRLFRERMRRNISSWSKLLQNTSLTPLICDSFVVFVCPNAECFCGTCKMNWL